MTEIPQLATPSNPLLPVQSADQSAEPVKDVSVLGLFDILVAQPPIKSVPLSPQLNVGAEKRTIEGESFVTDQQSDKQGGAASLDLAAIQAELTKIGALVEKAAHPDQVKVSQTPVTPSQQGAIASFVKADIVPSGTPKLNDNAVSIKPDQAANVKADIKQATQNEEPILKTTVPTPKQAATVIHDDVPTALNPNLKIPKDVSTQTTQNIMTHAVQKTATPPQASLPPSKASVLQPKQAHPVEGRSPKLERIDRGQETQATIRTTAIQPTPSRGIDAQVSGGFTLPAAGLQNGKNQVVREGPEFLTLQETSTRQTASMTVPQQTTANAPQADARHIAMQLATQFAKQGDGSTIIRLNPEELGQVKMTLRTVDGVMAMSIVAERPETAEIMRRNINELVQEFQALGYDNLSFDFGGGDSAPADNTSAAPLQNDEADQRNDAPVQSHTAHDMVADGHLNLRL